MRYVYALFVLVMLFGCHKQAKSVSEVLPHELPTSEPTVVLHMDTEFDAGERGSIQFAADTWRKQTSGAADIQLVWDADFSDLMGLGALMESNSHIVVRRTSDMEIVQAEDEDNGCKGCVLGWMNAGGIHGPGHEAIHGAFVVDRMTTGDLAAVALHEFGHVLGLSHVPEVQAVMFFAHIPGTSLCLKKRDLVEFCSVNECGEHRMLPCE